MPVGHTNTQPDASGQLKIGAYTEDLTGQKFTRLTVVRLSHKAESGHVSWCCRCDCGNEKVVAASHLKRGYIHSCGCLLRETRAARKGKKTGLRHHVMWHTWKQMIARCHNPKRESYINYGARGIRVCERWLNSFDDFVSDMGVKPSVNHSLDRIDNDGPYSPENCRWATGREQQRNRRCSKIIEFRGEKLSLTEWSERLGLTATALRVRIERWDFELAITTPGNRAKKKALQVERLRELDFRAD